MSETAKAVAAAYADAADLDLIRDAILDAHDMDATPYAYAISVAAAILARAAAVAADPALIGVGPWTPPPEADRPDGYRCLATVVVRWYRGHWCVYDRDCGYHRIPAGSPIAFAPLPSVKGAQYE